MPEITKSTGLFSPKQVSDVFNRVAGFSSIAALSGQTPIPFSGIESFIFSMDGEASIVEEGANKPAGESDWKKVTIRPLKVVHQARMTDEFKYMSEEAGLPYLEQYMDGFAKKIARAIDIMAFHGLNPATKEKAAVIGDNNFDDKITSTITFDAANADDNIQDAVNTIVGKDRYTTGMALAPTFATAMGNLKEKKDSRVPMYPEFRFGGAPAAFGGMKVSVNPTVVFGDSPDECIMGDFSGAFKWGYAQNVKTEMIEFGDPDGLGDLKRTNEIVLRAEAYIGWGIIDPDSFVRIVNAAPASSKAATTESK